MPSRKNIWLLQLNIADSKKKVDPNNINVSMNPATTFVYNSSFEIVY